MSVGRILGRYSRKDVSLPVENDVVLENTTDCAFDPVCPQAFGEARTRFYQRILPVTQQFERDVTTEPFVYRETRAEGHPTQVQFDSQPPQYFQQIGLGRLLVYRPKSSVHFQISATRTTACEAPTTPSSKSPVTVDKKVHSIHVRRLEDHPLRIAPVWRLLMIEATQGTPDGPLFEEDEEEMWLEIRMIIDLYPFKYHWYQMQLADENRLFHERCLRQLSLEALSQAAALSRVLDSPAPAQLYFPNFFGDVAARAKRFYDQKKIGLAHTSSIEVVRRLNNQVKAILIKTVCPSEAEVLDLACGHAQDLMKYRDKNVRLYFGIDLSPEEIDEANKRIRKAKARTRTKTSFIMLAGNLLQDETWNTVTKRHPDKFHVVSIQLAIHYLFESEQACHDFLSRVSAHMKEGAYLIGSTGDCDRLAKLFASRCARSDEDGQLQYSVGNDFYRVSFNEETMTRIRGRPDDVGKSNLQAPLNFDPTLGDSCNRDDDDDEYDRQNLRYLTNHVNSTWGVPYSFWLVDHIAADEYIVPWKAFVDIAHKYDLHLDLHVGYSMGFPTQCNFIDFVNKNMETELMKEFVARNPRLDISDQEQREVSAFYKAFSFVKSKGGAPALRTPLLTTPDRAMSAISTPTQEEVGFMGRSAPSTPATPSPVAHDFVSLDSIGEAFATVTTLQPGVAAQDAALEVEAAGDATSSESMDESSSD